MGSLPEIDRSGYRMRELRIVDDRGRRVAGLRQLGVRRTTAGRYMAPGAAICRDDDKIKDDCEICFDDEIAALQRIVMMVGVQLAAGAGSTW